MTTLEFFLNGKSICIAGIDSKTSILSDIVNLAKRNNDEEIFLMVSGQNNSKSEQYQWTNLNLKLNDELVIRIGNSNNVSEAKTISREELKENVIESKLKHFYKLKEELAGHLKE
jgi:hypothetical protein